MTRTRSCLRPGIIIDARIREDLAAWKFLMYFCWLTIECALPLDPEWTLEYSSVNTLMWHTLMLFDQHVPMILFKIIGQKYSIFNHGSGSKVAKLNNDNIEANFALPWSRLGVIGDTKYGTCNTLWQWHPYAILFPLSPSQRRTSSRSSTNGFAELSELGDSAVASQHWNVQNAYLFLLSTHWSHVTCSGVFASLGKYRIASSW